MMSAFFCTACGSSARQAITHARPPMTLSGVPTSWAMPAASWPVSPACRVAQPHLQLQLGIDAGEDLLMRLAQRAGHLIEAVGEKADFVAALRRMAPV